MDVNPISSTGTFSFAIQILKVSFVNSRGAPDEKPSNRRIVIFLLVNRRKRDFISSPASQKKAAVASFFSTAPSRPTQARPRPV